MLDQVAAAFARQDYETAAQLVKQLQRQSPEHPWVKLFIGRLQEIEGQFASAEQIYRALLQETTHPKIALQARQGLHRLASSSPLQQPAESTIAPGQSDSSHCDPNPGAIVLEAIDAAARQTAAQNFARILRLDTYSARLLLPGRGWRLYRLGAIGELETLGQQLVVAGIPAFWLPLTAVQRIRVFRVESLQSTATQATAICHSEAQQKGSLRFDWSEVTGRVEGRLPIFEQVVDMNMRNQLTRKQQTQDYAQVLDLHLPQRNSILRFGDWSYQFQSGCEFTTPAASLSDSLSSNRLKWNQLVRSIDDRLTDVPVWSDFTAFGESALELLTIGRNLPAHIDLLRKAPTPWDTAFQLYSGLVFEQKSKRSP